MADGEREVRYHARIRDLPASARPRERLRDAGPGALASLCFWQRVIVRVELRKVSRI